MLKMNELTLQNSAFELEGMTAHTTGLTQGAATP